MLIGVKCDLIYVDSLIYFIVGGGSAIQSLNINLIFLMFEKVGFVFAKGVINEKVNLDSNNYLIILPLCISTDDFFLYGY